MTVGLDLHSLDENARIKLIGESVTKVPQSSTDRPPMNAFIVETEVKADRYIRKLAKRFPAVRIVDRSVIDDGLILVRVAGPLR